ncbi:DUF3617 domain-containing protein [Sphingomicrobium nitratireducens]|uniref:DUF3617 domain-containing protein n=1 Tax=Sphingomicrobium nitratireducens TaxID=2964666 RepID=UPI0022403352|nr:DUF3617 domain-containing protein [Sphingomicrobium nitratireducens]
MPRTIHLLSGAALALGLAACSSEPAVEGENMTAEQVAKEMRDAAATGSFFRAGQWESTVEIKAMEIDGVAQGMDNSIRDAMGQQTFSVCLTEEDVKQPDEDFFTGADSDCTYENFSLKGGKMNAKMRCTSGGAIQDMTMSGTYDADNYAIDVSTLASGTPGGMSMDMAIRAKRVGDCAAAEELPGGE